MKKPQLIASDDLIQWSRCPFFFWSDNAVTSPKHGWLAFLFREKCIFLGKKTLWYKYCQCLLDNVQRDSNVRWKTRTPDWRAHRHTFYNQFLPFQFFCNWCHCERKKKVEWTNRVSYQNAPIASMQVGQKEFQSAGTISLDKEIRNATRSSVCCQQLHSMHENNMLWKTTFPNESEMILAVVRTTLNSMKRNLPSQQLLNLLLKSELSKYATQTKKKLLPCACYVIIHCESSHLHIHVLLSSQDTVTVIDAT